MMANDSWLRDCYQALQEAGATIVRTAGGHTVMRLGETTLVLPSLGRHLIVNKNVVQMVDRALAKAKAPAPPATRLIVAEETNCPIPSRTLVDRPGPERACLARLVERGRYLTIRVREGDIRSTVRGELEALCWVIGELGGAWGLAETEEFRKVLRRLAGNRDEE